LGRTPDSRRGRSAAPRGEALARAEAEQQGRVDRAAMAVLLLMLRGDGAMLQERLSSALVWERVEAPER
jgi:hypothetical protein